MKLIAANPIPGLSDIFKANPAPAFHTLGDVLSGLINIVFYIATFMAFYWLVWGAFEYILASGKKEELARARSRISWALIGLLVVFMAYFIAKFVSEIFPPSKGALPF